MSDKHAEMRDKKLHKRRYGMKVSGRSIKSVLLPLLAKKAGRKEKGG
jgi:hypothetical protein